MEVIESSPIQNCSGMENDRGGVSDSMRKYQERKKRKLLRREATENPESKLEVVRKNVDMIPQPSIQDNPNTELGTTATVQLRRHKKRTKRKLLSEDTENPERKLEVDCQNVDVIPQSSIQDNPNTELGTTATVQLRRRKRSTKRKLLSEDTENTEGKLEVSRQNVDIIITQPSIQDNPNTDLGTTATIQQDNPNAELVTTATVQLRRHKRRTKGKLLSEDIENPERKLEVSRQNIDIIITQPSIQDNPNTDLGTTAPVQLSKRQIRKNRKLPREETENPESKMEVPFQNGEMASGTIANPDAEMVSKGEEHTEVANGQIGSDMPKNVPIEEGTTQKKKKKKKSRKEKPTLGGILNSQQLEDTEVAIGETASGTIPTPNEEVVSKGEEHTAVANGLMGSDMPKNVHVEGTIQQKKKKSRRKKPVLGEVLNSRQLEDMEVVIGETASGSIATPDAEMVSKGEEHTEVANGQMESDMPKNVHIEGTMQKKKKKKSRKEKPILGEISNSQQLEDMEVAIGETGSGTTTTDNNNIASKKRKRQKLENKNPATGDILGTRECIQETTLAKKDLTSNRVVEPTNSESISCKTATPDAMTVSKGKEHTEVANGEMGSSKTENLNVNGTIQKRNEQKSKNEMSTSGEILNSQNLTAGNSATDSKSEAKRKKRPKKKAAKGEILTTIENPQVSVIAKKDEDANKVLEATSTESKREDKLEIGTTITKIVSKVKEECTEVGNNETEKKEGVGLKAIDVISRFPTSTKKLLVFDVNGLLADIVQPPPKDAKADMYIIKRAIFKRPFLEDFLYFCFERFHIGIWSSRNMTILKPVVSYLLGDLKYKLLFLWDAGRCTRSRMNTLEVRHKKIVFKDLGMIWEKNGPNNSWQKGTFNESNTLLLDDSPYKALLNPKHSGIFPVSYSYKNKNDDFLGPNGSLRTYLDGLATTDDLKTYVEQNPFGQRFIDEKTPQWTYYSRAIKSSCQ